MHIFGNPPPRLARALQVISTDLHTEADRQSRVPRGITKCGCIFSSLVVRDVIRASGCAADVASVCLAMVATSGMQRVYQQGYGLPSDKPAAADAWNGHMVVIVEGFLIDTTLYRSPAWRGPAEMIAVPLRPAGYARFMDRDVLAHLISKPAGSTVAYSMVWMDNASNEGWKKTADAKPYDFRHQLTQRLVAKLRSPKGDSRRTVSAAPRRRD